MKITEAQEDLIRQKVVAHQFQLQGLADDLIDHIYCYMHEHGREDQDFDEQLNEAIRMMAPDGLNAIENETFYLLNFKRMILMKRLLFVLGLLSTMALSSGVIFKLSHWPGANVLLGSGTIVGLLIYLPLWAFDKMKYKMVQRPLDRWKLLIGLSAGILMGLGTLMKTFHYMGAEMVFTIGAFVFIIGFLPLFFFSSYRKSIEA